MKQTVKYFHISFIISIILSIFSSALNVIGGYELSTLLNAAAGHSINELAVSTLIIICIWGAFFLANTLRKNYNFKLKTRINNHLRALTSEELIYMPNGRWMKEKESAVNGSSVCSSYMYQLP